MKSGRLVGTAGALALGLWGHAAHAQSGSQPQPGWTLYTQAGGGKTFLRDLNGNLVHQWTDDLPTRVSVYLLPGGSILRSCVDPDETALGGAAGSGRLRIHDWDNNLVWDYKLADGLQRAHHDAMPLPNGNVLTLVRNRLTAEEAVALGRDPGRLADGEFWTESVVEIRPTGPTTGEIVWRWDVADHIVQNFDPTKPNYADPADHPDRLDINFPYNTNEANWMHLNGLSYDYERNQVIVSCHRFSEFWIIDRDHPEAGLAYRWGNPRAYNTGGPEDQQLFNQHNPNFIPLGLPGEGNVMVFNNGNLRGPEVYSDVLELVLPREGDGFAHTPGEPYGPAAPSLRIDHIDGARFYSPFLSSAQRLANGNTLICIGLDGLFVEVTPSEQKVWEYRVPLDDPPPTFRVQRIYDRDPRLDGVLWCMADVSGPVAGRPDQVVDQTDLQYFLQAWFAGNSLADVGRAHLTPLSPAWTQPDGIVNGADLSLFVERWLDGC